MSVAPLQLLKSEFNPLVYVALDNATDKYVSLAYYYGATTTTPSDAYFTKGALLVHATDGTTYQNTAADGATPTWTALGGGGGGIAIGDTITDADATSILYVDGSGNLTQDTGFTRTSTGVTNISSTFSGETLQYQITDNLLGSGKNAILTQFTVPLGSLMDYTFSDDGVIISTKELSYPSATATTYSEFSYNKYSGTVTLETDQGNLEVRSQESSLTKITDLNGMNQYKTGFTTTGGYAKVGDIDGGNSTYIKVDDLNQQITITNVPTYADDAAAITGGLTTGMLYKTTTGGITALNIVP